MSRCFPFPPPGYMRNGSCGEALIESIKLQREKEKAKKDRKKDKKRERKEKKKERKGKERTASFHANVGKEFKLFDQEKIRTDEGSGCLQRRDDYEDERFERSDITEEHDQPFSPRELCCLSDSTQSGKRKRSTSPSSHDHGAVIKILFPLRKHGEPKESKVEDRLCHTSRSTGTADSTVQDTNGSGRNLIFTNAERYQCLGNSDSKSCKELQSSVNGAAPVTNLLDDESGSIVSVYDALLQIWVPSPFTCEGFKAEDQNWLFCSELQDERPVSKKVKSVADDACRCSRPSMWPRAEYLSDVELYALPYAVPF